MKFEEVFDKYLKNSSVSKHQAEFIWNHAIKQYEQRLICNFYPNDSHDTIYRLSKEEQQSISVPDYF